jgi:hypothetical protein
MKKHTLKCWPVFFAPILTGEKPFEIRLNDRDYEVGDILRLEEWEAPVVDPLCAHHGSSTIFAKADEPLECTCFLGRYTGRVAERFITYITDFAQQPSYVVMGLGDSPEWFCLQNLSEVENETGDAVPKWDFTTRPLWKMTWQP